MPLAFAIIYHFIAHIHVLSVSIVTFLLFDQILEYNTLFIGKCQAVLRIFPPREETLDTKGERGVKNTVRVGQGTLVTLALMLYFAEIIILEQTTLPYTLLASLGVVIIDLFLWSPIRAGTAAVCWRIANQENCERGFLHYGFSPNIYGKAVILRVWIWKKRVVQYTVFLLPSAFLSVLSKQLYETALPEHAQILGLMFHVGAWLFLLFGIVFIEIRLLRYKAAWYLLPLCQSVKEAIKASKSLSICCVEDILLLSLSHPFLFVDLSFASWVTTQTRRSRHVYIFPENTNNDTGINDVRIIPDGGNKYERA